MLTITTLKQISPRISPNILSPLNALILKYNLNTKHRVAAFLAQACFESAYFTTLQENLNYTAVGLLKTFPTHFKNLADATAYANNPKKIANRVYANRYGNGDESSGDGWKYSGKGVFQLTFKDNYNAYGKATGKTVDQAAAYLLTTEGALDVAGWFWQTHNLNTVIDTNNFTQVTQIINGGQNGASDRLNLYNKILTLV